MLQASDLDLSELLVEDPLLNTYSESTKAAAIDMWRNDSKLSVEDLSRKLSIPFAVLNEWIKPHEKALAVEVLTGKTMIAKTKEPHNANFKQYSDEFKQQAIQLWEKNHRNIKATCAELDISRATLYLWVQPYINKPVATTTRFPIAEVNKALIAWKKSGLTRAEFAQQIGIGYSTFSRWVERSEKAKKVNSNMNTHIKYTHEFRNKILKELEETDVSKAELAEKYNIVVGNIYNWIANKKRKKVPKTLDYSIEFKRKIIDEYNAGGVTFTKLANKYNLSSKTVQNWVIRDDARISTGKVKKHDKRKNRKKGAYYKDKQAKVIATWKENTTLSAIDISKSLDMPYETVWKWLQPYMKKAPTKGKTFYKQSFKDTIINEWLEDKEQSIIALAQKYKIPHATLYQWLDIYLEPEGKMNIKPRPKFVPQDYFEPKELEKLRKENTELKAKIAKLEQYAEALQTIYKFKVEE